MYYLLEYNNYETVLNSVNYFFTLKRVKTNIIFYLLLLLNKYKSIHKLRMKFQTIHILLLLFIIIIITLIIFKSTGSSKDTKLNDDEYFTIMSNELNDCEDVLYDDYVADWEYDNTVLGKGKNATVYGGYGTINGKKVKVAIKVIDYVSRDRFLKEVLFQIQAAASQLAPIVYDAFRCGDTGYIVTSKIHKTLKEYLETFPRGSKEQMDMFDLLKEKAKKLLISSNKASLLHTDRHIDNFGVVLNKAGVPKLVLIDWDAATGVKLGQTGINDVLNKLDQTFQLLKTNLLAPPSMYKYKVPEGPSKKRTAQPRTEIKPKSSSSLAYSTFSEPRPQSDILSTNTSNNSPIRFSSFGSIEDNDLSPFSTPVKNKSKDEEEQKYESPFKIRKTNRNLFDDEDEMF